MISNMTQSMNPWFNTARYELGSLLYSLCLCQLSFKFRRLNDSHYAQGVQCSHTGCIILGQEKNGLTSFSEKGYEVWLQPEDDPQRLSHTRRWIAVVIILFGTICLDSLFFFK